MRKPKEKRASRRAPLFSAIVLAGVSLTVAEACDDVIVERGDAGQNPVDGGATAADGSPDTGDADAACPPDSEIPTQPCALIR